MKKVQYISPIIFCVFLMITFFTISCGGGGGGGGSSGTSDLGFVTITDPTSDSKTTTDCNEIYLSGDAFISKTWSRCCLYSAEDTGVTVTWENKTSGASGRTEQSVDYCGFLGHYYLCDHTWSVTIPLVLGDNNITITASDPGGVTGHDYITVKKPVLSYSISGKVTNTSGLAIWNLWNPLYSGVRLTLQGTQSTFYAYTDKDGNYSCSCFINDSYTITPSSNINFTFTPLSRNVTVSNADVTNQDFVTEAYFISGQIKNAAGAGVLSAIVSLSGATSLVYLTDYSGGYYNFAVPNGSYTITVSCIFSPCTFTPNSRNITVNNADVTGQDFVTQ